MKLFITGTLDKVKVSLCVCVRVKLGHLDKQSGEEQYENINEKNTSMAKAASR